MTVIWQDDIDIDPNLKPEPIQAALRCADLDTKGASS